MTGSVSGGVDDTQTAADVVVVRPKIQKAAVLEPSHRSAHLGPTAAGPVGEVRPVGWVDVVASVREPRAWPSTTVPPA